MSENGDPRILADRRKALEEEFFAKESKRKLEALRGREGRKATREELAEVIGIDDEAVLDHLVELGVTPGTVAALRLVPLVEVAWATGKMEEKEKEVVLAMAKEAGIDARHPAHSLLERWLFHRPPPQMLEAWTAYVKGLCQQLDPELKRAFRENTLARARRVGEAAGGVLGLGKTSPEQEAMLGVLERAFED